MFDMKLFIFQVLLATTGMFVFQTSKHWWAKDDAPDKSSGSAEFTIGDGKKCNAKEDNDDAL